MFNFDFHQLLLTAPAVILALSFHEYGHARAAYALGDPTAKILGRMTVNPLKHLDVIGTLMLLFFSFGWAKPVPFNPNNLRTENKYFGALLVSIAGPLMNIALMLVGSALILLIYFLTESLLMSNFWADFMQSIITFLLIFSQLNLVLAIFNLIPVPPLDGSKILAGLLPQRWAAKIYQYEQYGFIVMVLLLATGALNHLISPVISGYYDIMNNLLFIILG